MKNLFKMLFAGVMITTCFSVHADCERCKKIESERATQPQKDAGFYDDSHPVHKSATGPAKSATGPVIQEAPKSE